MSKKKKKDMGIAAAYAQWRKSLGNREVSLDEAKEAAQKIREFGLEADQLIIDKLKSAPPEELSQILAVAAHLESPEIEEGLLEVIEKRAVPLAIKLKCFEVMTDLGFSIESELLQQLQELEEIYHQLGTHLGKGGKEAVEHSLSLAEDLMAMPRGFKLSFLRQVKDEWGEKAIPFAGALACHDPEVDQLVLMIIGDAKSPEAIEALNQIAEYGTKEASKTARKALYKLRQKGLITATEETGEPETALAEAGEQAYASNIDTFGSRLLLLAIPGLREILVCQGSVEEERGLLRFSAAEMQRKAYRTFLKELREQIKSDRYSSLVEIDPGHCRWLLEQAYVRAQVVGTLIPGSYKSLRYRLKAPEGHNPGLFVRKRVEVSEDEVGRVSARLEEVFSVPDVAIWMIDKEALIPYARRYVEMAESKLVINEQQRQARLDDALTDFTAEYFSQESGRLDLMARRLEETGYLLSLQGKTDEARLLEALALDLAGSSFLKPHEFLRQFMLRSIVGTLHALQEEQKKAHGGDSNNRIVKLGEE
ncbi:MAG TPA: hypothetical protein VMX35_16025 [Acidobacteriota bacterium]|nr:hypothetical protein [Acidobacteriota bacterium]